MDTIQTLDTIWMQKRMDTIFMNSKSSKTSDPHRLLFDISEKKKKLKKM